MYLPGNPTEQLSCKIEEVREALVRVIPQKMRDIVKEDALAYELAQDTIEEIEEEIVSIWEKEAGWR